MGQKLNNLLSELLASNLNSKCKRDFIRLICLNKERSYLKHVRTNKAHTIYFFQYLQSKLRISSKYQNCRESQSNIKTQPMVRDSGYHPLTNEQIKPSPECI